MKHSRQCPECCSELIYEMGRYYMCLNCAHDWDDAGPGKVGIVRPLAATVEVKGEANRATENMSDSAEG